MKADKINCPICKKLCDDKFIYVTVWDTLPDEPKEEVKVHTECIKGRIKYSKTFDKVFML